MKTYSLWFHLKLIPTVLGLILLLAACQPSTGAASPAAAPDLESILPADNTIPGWEISEPVVTFDRTNLFGLVNGQADGFYAYGFEQVAVQRYQNSSAARLNVEIWQLATSADAYGLFHMSQAGQPASIGVEGASDPGWRLAFWQGRYFVSLTASEAIPDDALWAFGEKIAGVLPPGGEPPAIVKRLPAAGLVEGSLLFFHEEISIQMEIWLGGENILGLSQETNGIIARYDRGDQEGRLMLIEYPAAAEADRALQALQASQGTDIAAYKTKGALLAAVFGELEASNAQALLNEALK